MFEVRINSMKNSLYKNIVQFFLPQKIDLRMFDPRKVYQSMKGYHKTGLYYLWPAQKTYFAERDDAMVEENDFFQMVQNCEHVGISTRYPAPSHLYRQLCGKQ